MPKDDPSPSVKNLLPGKVSEPVGQSQSAGVGTKSRTRFESRS